MKRKNPDKEILKLMTEFMDVLSSPSITNLFDKKMVDDMVLTFTDVLKDNPEFHRLLADPTVDLTSFEPIIKNLVKKRKKK